MLTVIVLPWLPTLSTSALADETSTDKQAAHAPLLPIDTLPKELDLARASEQWAQLSGQPEGHAFSANRVALGRRLFFDPILSKDRTVSCASCHQPKHGFASPDPKAVGIGGQTGPRNAPTVLNRGLGKLQFWDGRANSLEEQALQPIANSRELGHSVEGAVASLRADSTYPEQFRLAFEADESVTSENLGKALASFQRALLTGDSPVDKFQSGDYDALTSDERQGLWIFESRGQCWKCHSGNNYTDESFHNTGIGYGRKDRDLGRFEVTKKAADKAKFKTPTLRAIAQTAPYMHDGSLKTLKDVVDFYNIGGNSDDPQRDRELKPLGLSVKELAHLVAFLKAVSRE